jgi:nucleotide-binding universal stress UspA family protein
MAIRDTQPRTVVVVGVDFSPASELAVREALRAVQRAGDGELHAVHALSEHEGGLTETKRMAGRSRLLDELPEYVRIVVAKEAQALGILAPPSVFGVHVRIGPAARVIVQLSVDVTATLVVVGTHGRDALGRMLLGSVAAQLVRDARCPVLVARAQSYDGVRGSDQIDPPCPACLEKRRATASATWWCDVHARPHITTHIYTPSQAGTSWATHDAEVSFSAPG